MLVYENVQGTQEVLQDKMKSKQKKQNPKTNKQRNRVSLGYGIDPVASTKKRIRITEYLR